MTVAPATNDPVVDDDAAGTGDPGSGPLPEAQADAPSDDGDAPPWPDEDEEASAMADRETAPEPRTIREQSRQDALREKAEQAEMVRDLPPISDLVEKVPPEVRERLEQLFRAKFTKVRRVPKRFFS